MKKRDPKSKVKIFLIISIVILAIYFISFNQREFSQRLDTRTDTIYNFDRLNEQWYSLMLSDGLVERSFRNQQIFMLEKFLSKEKYGSIASFCVERYSANELTEYLLDECVDPTHSGLFTNIEDLPVGYTSCHTGIKHYSSEFKNKLFDANLNFVQSFSFCDNIDNMAYAGWCWPTDPECPDDAPE